ncbi:AAA family ATPase [Nonomuraea guangzhouensis]|uniref:ATP/GTP-binding protein n=1 Tax=Nonomuraea guangzhouensis TaxID=1291555 RepID=A0ABW4G3W7_9ACTN|nr:ATP-binding protein [Nonomuraea guangzhouensis]
MLLRFRGANHRSFRDEFEVWLAASKFNQEARRPAGLAEDPDLAYLPATAIYGSNASGKSNVLHAIRWMRQAVLNSVHGWSTLDGIPREPYELDPDARTDTSLFEVDIVLDGDRYVYGFEVSDQQVETEWLHTYPGGQARRQVWFERDADADEPFAFPGEGLKGPKESLVSQTRPDALFLTVAAAFNQPYLKPIHDWFRHNLWWISPGHDFEDRQSFTRKMLDDPRQRERIIGLLKVADLGVVGTEIDSLTGELRLVHEGSHGPVALSYERQESMGTRSWFAFLGPLLTTLDHGAALLVDELDTSLHPLFAAEVLRLFQDPAANPNNAQLVCTVHDATLLGRTHIFQPLERDQVRITVKNRHGASEIYPLTDARPRKTEALDRNYLAGVYGGVPRLTVGEIAETLARPLTEPTTEVRP